ncbi:MAG: tRNA pseudouridine(13) synthase TruD [Gammaproteobacteria bacterium]|nr:tRNA pseudouridine(13) synthase TruD [Gammaproteobacteria bacterium]
MSDKGSADLVVDFSSYPHAFGVPAASGVIRHRAEDFRVDEILGFEPDGDGDHWLLCIEKKDSNSDWVAKQLANHAGVRFRDVGFNGMKDRHAVTTQWYSLPAGQQETDWSSFSNPEFRITAVHRHRRKLRRGSHVANRFALVIRDVTDVDSVLARVDALREQGVPDYFGPQRFGRGGHNVVRALDGAKGGIYLSAVRSYLFNAVLAVRVEAGTWQSILPGEIVQLAGSRSVFSADGEAGLDARLASGDINPTGPLWGRGELMSQGECAALEMAVAGRYPELVGFLEKEKLKQERRSLRQFPQDLTVEAVDADVLRCDFSLPAGSFATSVLRELLHFSEAPLDPGQAK